MAGGAGHLSVLRERHVCRDLDVLRPEIYRMEVAFGKYLFVAPFTKDGDGRRHLAFQNFSGRISQVAGEAFLKFMRLCLHAVNHDADENTAEEQGSN